MHLFKRPLRGAFLTSPKRPLRGAFFIAVSVCSWQGHAIAADAAPKANVEQLRVHGVADQLIGFLNQAISWTGSTPDRPPLASIRPQIRAAVLAHPEVRLSSEQKLTAGFATREAFAGYLPQVSANVDTGQRRNDPVNKPWITLPAHQDNSKSLGITARQMLYDFGAVSGRVDAQRARESAADAKSEAKRSELVLRAVSAWHEVFRTRQLLKLAEVNRLSRQQILSFIEEREQLGGSSRSDVLRAKARLSDAQAALVAAQSRLKTTEASYRETFGSAPGAGLVLPEAVALDLNRFDDAEGLILRNASYAEALAQSLAAGHDAKSAAASMLPSLNLEASATRRDIGGGAQPGVDRTFGLVVRQNFYTGGAETARKNQAEQRAVESRLELDNLRRQLERAIGQTLADARYTDALITARRDAVQVAASAFEAVREQFAFRRGTLLDLLRAQEELYIAGHDLIDGVVDHALARHRLLHLAMELTPLFDIGAAARKE